MARVNRAIEGVGATIVWAVLARTRVGIADPPAAEISPAAFLVGGAGATGVAHLIANRRRCHHARGRLGRLAAVDRVAVFQTIAEVAILGGVLAIQIVRQVQASEHERAIVARAINAIETIGRRGRVASRRVGLGVRARVAILHAIAWVAVEIANAVLGYVLACVGILKAIVDHGT